MTRHTTKNRFTILLLFVWTCHAQNLCNFPDQKALDQAAKNILIEYDRIGSNIYNQASVTQWNYMTNLTDYNNQINIVQLEISYEEMNKFASQVKEIFGAESGSDQGCWTKISNPETKKAIKNFFNSGTAILPKEHLNEILKLKSKMKSFYSKHTVEGNTLEPNVIRKFQNSTNYWELRHYWQLWFDDFSKQKENFIESHKFEEQACKLNGYKNCAETWRASYVTEDNYSDQDFQENLEHLWTVLKPLYEKIHAYARHHLSRFYGDNLVSRTGPIPSHILGNPWAQSFINLYDNIPGMIPYPNEPTMDIDEGPVKRECQNYRSLSSCHYFFYLTRIGQSRVGQGP